MRSKEEVQERAEGALAAHKTNKQRAAVWREKGKQSHADHYQAMANANYKEYVVLSWVLNS